MIRWPGTIILGLAVLALAAVRGEAAPASITNSLGTKLVRIEAGAFQMGQAQGGDFDERPVHKVTISRPFYMAVTEVTNVQYEQFNPGHRKLRGERGFSKGDDEAVVFVSWREAAKFCEWLSKMEGKPYRLPTEAEWEYACRAGATTPFSTGEELPKAFLKNPKFDWDPKPVSLAVGKTPPNPWGLCDMHGNVEEWCFDGYGPYAAGDQTDPVGRAGGEMKVARGGSHNTDAEYLRSANRSGTLPDDKSWIIGFRVVLGEPPATQPLPAPGPAPWARDVQQTPYAWPKPVDPDKPFFDVPRCFVRIPPESNGPMFSKHNHCPSITWCPNGDLLAVWFSTNTEKGREMTILASRLRQGTDRWDPAAEFFKAPDRNMTGSALWCDGDKTLFHFNGLEAAGGWANLALVMRTSADNGVTWQTRLIEPHHQRRNQVISGTLRTKEGCLIQACDAAQSGSGGTALHISRDGGQTWTDPGAGKPDPTFEAGKTGAWIAGIHAGVVQLADGSLLALGRGNTINGRMPLSRSRDMGATWTYSAGEFPPISSGQRLVLRRLRDGPILLVTFTDSSSTKKPEGLLFRDGSGAERRGYGVFAALSFDEGQSWPVRKLLTLGGAPREFDGGAWTRHFVMDDTHAEPRGYFAATQSPDGAIHVISSALYYRFNLVWIKTPAAADKPAVKTQ